MDTFKKLDILLFIKERLGRTGMLYPEVSELINEIEDIFNKEYLTKNNLTNYGRHKKNQNKDS